MCAEESTVLRAVAADFFFNCWYLEIPSETVFGTYQGAPTIMRKAFEWKRSRISMLEVGYEYELDIAVGRNSELFLVTDPIIWMSETRRFISSYFGLHKKNKVTHK
jgi:hypothetical protein